MKSADDLYTWKKLGNTSSPYFMFLEFQLPVACRYQIFDCIHLKALSIRFCSNLLRPQDFGFVLRRIQTVTRE